MNGEMFTIMSNFINSFLFDYCSFVIIKQIKEIINKKQYGLIGLCLDKKIVIAYVRYYKSLIF